MKILIKDLSSEILVAKMRDQEIEVDISREHNVSGSSPLEVFLTGLCACVSVYVKRYLKNYTQQHKDITVEVNGELTKESPYRFADIIVNINLPFDLGEKKEAFLRFVKNCPIHNTIHQAVNISINLNII